MFIVIYLVKNRDEAFLDGLDDLDIPAVGVVVLLSRGARPVYLLLEGQLDGLLAPFAPSLFFIIIIIVNEKRVDRALIEYFQ